MFVTRARYVALQVQYERVLDERDEAKRELAASRAANIRIAGRNTRLSELLDKARDAQDDAEFDRLLSRLERALRACGRYRAEAGLLRARLTVRPQAVVVDDPHDRIRKLEARLAELQAANDAMCREAATGAGTLARVPAEGPLS